MDRSVCPPTGSRIRRDAHAWPGASAGHRIAARARLQREALVTVTDSLESALSPAVVNTRGLPGYTFERAAGALWRSRFDAERNLIVVNNGHRDFVFATRNRALQPRYLVRLYVKESRSSAQATAPPTRPRSSSARDSRSTRRRSSSLADSGPDFDSSTAHSAGRDGEPAGGWRPRRCSRRQAGLPVQGSNAAGDAATHAPTALPCRASGLPRRAASFACRGPTSQRTHVAALEEPNNRRFAT